jgi:hypothetical protein
VSRGKKNQKNQKKNQNQKKKITLREPRDDEARPAHGAEPVRTANADNARGAVHCRPRCERHRRNVGVLAQGRRRHNRRLLAAGMVEICKSVLWLLEK